MSVHPLAQGTLALQRLRVSLAKRSALLRAQGPRARRSALDHAAGPLHSTGCDRRGRQPRRDAAHRAPRARLATSPRAGRRRKMKVCFGPERLDRLQPELASPGEQAISRRQHDEHTVGVQTTALAADDKKPMGHSWYDRR